MKKRWSLRDPFDRDFPLRIRMTVLMGAWGFLAFYLWSFFLPAGPLPKILRILAFISPVMGWIFYDALDTLVRRVFGGIFWPEKGKTARAHSEGESLVHRKDYVGAVEWFSATVMADPTDWQAQERIIEILLEHFDDRERVAEERNRLLKMTGVPKGLWTRTALHVGEDWVALGRPDRAINTYKTLLWKIPEGEDADEVRRRLKNLGV